jgi:hypothetical protein
MTCRGGSPSPQHWEALVDQKRSVTRLGLTCAALLCAACVGQLDVGPETADAGADAGSAAPDAGGPDSGTADSGTADAGASDAGGADAGTGAGDADAGAADAGDADAGADGGGLDPGDAGTADAGTDAGPVFTALSIPAAVTKVKTLLVGLPPSNDEVAAVVADPNALRGLIDQWAQTPQYDVKMRAFFSSAFQQSQVIGSDLDDQTASMHDANDPKVLQSLRESFARTAAQLVAEGRPFTETMTTRRFMMTPKLAALYAYTDTLLINDANQLSDQLVKNDPNFSITFQSGTSTTIDQSLNPADPNYLVFYHPKLAPAAGAQPYDALCPTDTITYNKATTGSVSQTLYSALTGLGLSQFNIKLADGTTHQCSPPSFPNVFAGADYNGWRMVTVRAPNPGEANTRHWDLNTLRTGSELVLSVPRVGFFTTLAFLGEYQTNVSNQARVTINQTMIVGLNKSIDVTNTTPPKSLASLDQAHAGPGTECYSCHQSLDPLRQLFRQQYSLHFHQQTDPKMIALPGQFAFHDVSVQGNSIFDLAGNLAGHPMFAGAWVQKLCTYATSSVCKEDDPEFQRLVAVFKASNFNWPTLVRELFSSPLVTYLSRTATSDQNGQVFPVSRRAHLCMTLSSRLGINDVCGLDVNTNVGSLGAIKAIAVVLPSDAYTRGSEAPVLANDPSLTFRTGMENICATLANNLVDANFKRYVSDTAAHQTTAIADMVHGLMGVTGDRDGPRISILTDHFNAAAAFQLAALPQTTPPTAPTAAQKTQANTDAMRSTFVLACLSPSVVGVGQ